MKVKHGAAISVTRGGLTSRLVRLALSVTAGATPDMFMNDFSSINTHW